MVKHSGLSSIINFAIVGFGDIGKRYAKMLLTNPSATLTALVDNHDQPYLPKEAPDGAATFCSIDHLLISETKHDVIIIASPNGLHFEQTIKALNAGKHVIVEKPLALKVEDVEAIISKAKEIGKLIFPILPNRNSPTARWLKQMVASGKLGSLFYLQINCFWNRDERYYNKAWRGKMDMDGGPLFTQFYHFVDLLFWIFGDITDIKAKFLDFKHQHLTETEDSGMINFELASGGVGSFNYTTSTWNQNLESSITIIADNGSIKIGGQYLERVEECIIKEYNETSKPLTETSSPIQNHKNQLDEIIMTLRGEKNVQQPLEETKKVIEIITRIYSQRTITKSFLNSICLIDDISSCTLQFNYKYNFPE